MSYFLPSCKAAPLNYGRVWDLPAHHTHTMPFTPARSQNKQSHACRCKALRLRLRESHAVHWSHTASWSFAAVFVENLIVSDSETFSMEQDRQNWQTGWLPGVLQKRQRKREPLVSFKSSTVFFGRYFSSSQQAIDTRKCSNSNLSGETANVTIRGR